MKKAHDAQIRDEYCASDLGKGSRGRFLRDYEEGSNLVMLSPDVATVFPTEESVNEALRSLITVAARATKSRENAVS